MSKIDSFLVDSMPDFEAIDSTIYFLQQYAANPGDFCDKPFMIALGIQKPHSHVYIPEQYFSDDYIDDFLAEPLISTIITQRLLSLQRTSHAGIDRSSIYGHGQSRASSIGTDTAGSFTMGLPTGI